jgi:hypothetical protein
MAPIGRVGAHSSPYHQIGRGGKWAHAPTQARRPSVIWDGNLAEHVHGRYTPGPTQRLAIAPLLRRRATVRQARVRPTVNRDHPRARQPSDHRPSRVSGTGGAKSRPTLFRFCTKKLCALWQTALSADHRERLSGRGVKNRAFPLAPSRATIRPGVAPPGRQAGVRPAVNRRPSDNRERLWVRA